MMLVELKNGETYNGHLNSCDNWMNIVLREVTLTSRDGDQFWKIPEVYIRGNTIKYLRIPDEVIEKVQAEERAGRGRGRGDAAGGAPGYYGGRGRGGPSGGAGRGGAPPAGAAGRGGPPGASRGGAAGGRGGAAGGRGGAAGGRGRGRGRGAD